MNGPQLHELSRVEFIELYDSVVASPAKAETFAEWVGEDASAEHLIRLLEDRFWAGSVFHPSKINNAIADGVIIEPRVYEGFCPGKIDLRAMGKTRTEVIGPNGLMVVEYL